MTKMSFTSDHIVKVYSFFRTGMPVTNATYSAVTAVFAAILILFSVYTNYAVRNSQLDVWKGNPTSTTINGVPSFSTADAPYYLEMARSVLDGEERIELEKTFPFREGTFFQK